jgi:hypothetical protein
MARLNILQSAAPSIVPAWTPKPMIHLERQGDLLCDSRTAPIGITLLHFDHRMNEIYARPLRTGLPTAIRGEQHAVLLLAQVLKTL